MGINLNESLIDEIKSKNDIVDVISKYVPLKKSGHNHKGLCPFHNEKTPSFMVSEEKQYFHCFGCGEAGDVINFIMKMESLDFVDGVTLLGDLVGISVDEISTSKQEKEEIGRKNIIYEINRATAIFFYKNLIKQNNLGLDYFYKRGLNIATIKKFGLGYAQNSWELLYKHLLTKGYDHKTIHTAGLILERKSKDGYFDRFRNRIMFPIMNTTGKVIGFGGRAIDDSNPKYLNSPETPVFNKGDHLYGLNFAKNEVGHEKQIIVVEGYMDVISLYQNGIKNATASLGTALTKNQASLLKRYAEEVIIAYDADMAGQAATLRGLDVLREVGCNVRVVSLSEGKDPDEFVMKKGREAFLMEIQNALPLIEYKILLAKKENDLTTSEGRIKFVKSITELLKQLKSPVEVDVYIKKIAMESQISADAIKSEIYGNNNPNNFKKNEKPPQEGRKYRSMPDRYTNKYSIQPVAVTEKSGHLEAERCLLKLMMMDKNIISKMKEEIDYEDFMDKTHCKIGEILFSLYDKNMDNSMEVMLNQLNIDEVSILYKINECIIPEDNRDRAVIDYVNTIKKYKLEKTQLQIEAELKDLEKIENKSQDQIVRIRELCINYERILKAFKGL